MNTDFPLFQTALAGIKKSSELWSETTNSTELGYEYDDTRDRAWISKLDIEKSCIKHYIQFVLISFCKIDISKREFGKGEFWGRIHLFTFLDGNGHGIWAWATITGIQNFLYDQQHLWSHIPQNLNKQRHHNIILLYFKGTEKRTEVL